MERFSEFFKKHKLLVGGGAAALVLLYLLLRRGGSATTASSGGPDAGTLQLAQLQASAQLQEAQIAGQTQTAQLSASTQQNEAQIAANAQAEQTQAELEAQNNSVAAQLTSQLYTQGTDTSLYQTELSDANEESLAYDALASQLAPIALKTATLGGRANSETGATELATILGQGGGAPATSLNQSLSAASIASTIENTQLLKGLESIGGSAVGVL